MTDPQSGGGNAAIVWRRETHEALVGARDQLGRRQPAKMSPLALLTCGWHQSPPRREVPGEFYALDLNDDGYTVAVIACPCGREPRAEVGALTECECDRTFLFAGEKLLVFNSPA